MKSDTQWDKDYYFKTVKFIRDNVHGYVYLTKFELELIDTREFQRLKDIRQLTCQHVYPGARHTRFEHSLGVLELTRQAVANLNNNGIISTKKHNIFNDQIRFNAEIAALLHDVGHCPFSHLGEREFDKDEVWNRLYNDVEDKLPNTFLFKQFKEKKGSNEKKPGSIHEQLSCIMILENFYAKLSDVSVKTNHKLYVDFELLLRCILGVKYDVSTAMFSRSKSEFKRNQKKNAIVNLINSHVFDMDKLDYIKRDSYMTGIGTPVVDTHRLFRNMYLTEDYSIMFTSRAVPALQNMIESRDSLYMYVYNHHAVVFSDFLNTYILRRLAHNFYDFQVLIKFLIDSINPPGLEGLAIQPEDMLSGLPITNLGMVATDYLFSSRAVVDEFRSDSDLISLLNVIYLALVRNGKDDNLLTQLLIGQIDEELNFEGLEPTFLNELNNELDSSVETEKRTISMEIESLVQNIKRVYRLIDSYHKRDYLKPWWKTYSEFNNFINNNFPSDKMRKQLCSWICQDEDGKPAGDEFRSQIAKHVGYITRKINEENVTSELLQPLNDGEFFVIQRSVRFFDAETVRELNVAQKINEMLGAPGNAKYHTDEYYVKELTNVIPQRDYYSMYAKNSFYVFSKQLDAGTGWTQAQQKRHYQLIEKIFAFVVSSFINQGAEKFQSKFGVFVDRSVRKNNEEKSEMIMYKKFVENYL